jgi:DNA-binding Lrp family transcriptional regulator
MRCYLYTHGFGRNPWVLNLKAIAGELNLSDKTVLRAIASLERDGLVNRIAAKHTGTNVERGTLLQVNLPNVVGAPQSVTDPQSVTPSQSVTDPQSDMRNKRHERQERKAPVAAAPAPDVLSVYDVRRIAARFQELHRGEADYTRERLRSDVCTALIGEGREPDDPLVDEAIG